MSAVFWNSQGVIYIDHLQKANSAAVLYNAELLGRLEAELQKERPHFVKKKVLFHHSNVSAHISTANTAKLVESN